MAALGVLGWAPSLAVCGRNRRYGGVLEIAVSLVSVPSKSCFSKRRPLLSLNTRLP